MSRRHVHFLFKAASVVLMAAVLVSCGGKAVQAPPPRTATLIIQGGTDLNPDANGRASPIVLRLYLVRDPEPILSAELDALQLREQEIVAPVQLWRRELTLQVGQRVEMPLELPADARALAAWADFRTPVGNYWKAATQLPEEPGSVFQVFVQLDARTVTAHVEQNAPK